jgi:hypothetical protein
MLLSGMAIENILKGVLILRDPTIASDTALSTRGWPGGKGGHALERMAEEVTGSLSDKERELIQRLEIFVIWAVGILSL